MAKANFPSHHPIKEGKMNCSDCHNPHGELQTEELARDLCLECHARYTGPFVYEHAPVEEDCNLCHDPHGTVANNLLQQNEPFLCLQCHESHFHASRIGADPGTIKGFSFDANKMDTLQQSDPFLYSVITDPAGITDPVSGLTGPLTPGEANTMLAANSVTGDVTINFTNQFGEEGWRKAFLTKCSTCHTVLHGSDLPSQSAPVFNSGNGEGFPDGGHGLTR
jgi:predicted CXXCH cytochrome family protein